MVGRARDAGGGARSPRSPACYRCAMVRRRWCPITDGAPSPMVLGVAHNAPARITPRRTCEYHGEGEARRVQRGGVLRCPAWANAADRAVLTWQALLTSVSGIGER